MLVPLDGSPFAERILEPAVELGSLQDADMTLLRVVRPVTDYSAGYPGVSLHPSVNGRQESEAWNYVRRVAERLGGEALRVDPRLIVDGEPTHAAILLGAAVDRALPVPVPDYQAYVSRRYDEDERWYDDQLTREGDGVVRQLRGLR